MDSEHRNFLLSDVYKVILQHCVAAPLPHLWVDRMRIVHI
jgi:hypothetical protein